MRTVADAPIKIVAMHQHQLLEKSEAPDGEVAVQAASGCGPGGRADGQARSNAGD